MGTTHYDINKLVLTDEVDLVNDYNESMDDIDTAIYNESVLRAGVQTNLDTFETTTTNNFTTTNGNVTTLQTAVNNLNTVVAKQEAELDIDVFHGSDTVEDYESITCTLVHNSSNYILVDTGYIGDTAAIQTWLASYLGTTKLNALVLTHMHSDHVSNYESIMTNFCDANTDIYVQMAPTSANGEYSAYSSYYSSIVAKASALSLKTPVVPTQGSSVTYGKIVCTFYNTNPAYKNAYDYSWANNGRYLVNGTGENMPTSGINNYSLVTRFELGKTSYIDTGDIEYRAQTYMAEFMQPATVIKNPHHYKNRMGYEKFFERCGVGSTVQMVLCTNHFRATTDASGTYWDLINSYFGRYMIYKQINVPVISNILANENVHIGIKDGTVINIVGSIVDKDWNDFTYHNLGLFGIFPPNYAPKTRTRTADGVQLTDCPYDHYYITLDDINALKNLAIGCPIITIETGATSSLAFLSGAKINDATVEQSIAKVFGDAGATKGSSTQYFIRLNDVYPVISRNATPLSPDSSNVVYEFHILSSYSTSGTTGYHNPCWHQPLKTVTS